MSNTIFSKGENKPLSKNFSSNEFQCRCSYDDCILQIVDNELINRLQKIRDEVGQPMRISSGYRCTKYQQHLRDTKASTVVAKKSQHELGKACDASCPIPMDDFLKICEKYFKSIGLGKTFLHLDQRDDKVRRWNY